jgi:hypothetical protein
MGEKYDHINDQEWVEIPMRGLSLACCDCSLVHRMNFRILTNGKTKRFYMQANRDERATAAMRRPMKPQLKKLLKEV